MSLGPNVFKTEFFYGLYHFGGFSSEIVFLEKLLFKVSVARIILDMLQQPINHLAAWHIQTHRY